MGIRREEVISHPFSEDFSSDDGSSSPEREFDVFSHDSDSISSSNMCSSDSRECVVHQVSKLDTLAGLAIKYGVEIADIKRMNNLVTDLQMFAHKSLVIPNSGCHTRSPLHSSAMNSKNRKLPPKPVTKKPNTYSVYSPESKSPPHRTSSAMSTLQRYYGLLPQKPGPSEEQCTEMAFFGKTTVITSPKRNSGDHTGNREMYSRRSKKSDADPPCDSTTPEMGESKWFSMRNTTSEDSLTHPLLVNGFNFVRRSASASGLRLRF